MARTLTARELNRAVLARQLLLERSGLALPPALERVGGIQAQYAPSMYIGLWSRLRDFERAALTRALERRSVVQATLLRSTIHLVSKRDYWPWAEAIRESRREHWLRVAPDPRVSGGEVIGGKVPRGSPRAARAFRLAAHSLHSSHSPLGDVFRRFRAKLGAAAAITALAHKLARIVYHLLTTRESYDESKVLAASESYRIRQEASLRKRARSLGYQIVPIQSSINAVP